MDNIKYELVFSAPMAGDRFKSPLVTAVARRQLAFGDNAPSTSQIVPTSPIRSGSNIASPQKTFIQVQGKSKFKC